MAETEHASRFGRLIRADDRSREALHIGCGEFAARCHGPAQLHYARAHAEVALATWADLSAERAETFRTTFG